MVYDDYLYGQTNLLKQIYFGVNLFCSVSKSELYICLDCIYTFSVLTSLVCA